MDKDSYYRAGELLATIANANLDLDGVQRGRLSVGFFIDADDTGDEVSVSDEVMGKIRVLVKEDLMLKMIAAQQEFDSL